MIEKLNVPVLPVTSSRELGAFASVLQPLLILIVNVLNRLIEGESARLKMEVLYAEPNNIADGDVIYADGTAWDPGSGRGLYERNGGAWVKL